MTKYIITATSEFLDDDPQSEIVIAHHLERLKTGKARLIDYMEDCTISIQKVQPIAPDEVKYLNCRVHGEQPFKLSFAPDVYTCQITNCDVKYEWAEVWGDQYNVGG